MLGFACFMPKKTPSFFGVICKLAAGPLSHPGLGCCQVELGRYDIRRSQPLSRNHGSTWCQTTSLVFHVWYSCGLGEFGIFGSWSTKEFRELVLTVKLSLVYCMQLFFSVCVMYAACCMLISIVAPSVLHNITIRFCLEFKFNQHISTQRVSHVVRKEMDGVALSLAVSCFAWLQRCFLLAQGPLCWIWRTAPNLPYLEDGKWLTRANLKKKRSRLKLRSQLLTIRKKNRAAMLRFWINSAPHTLWELQGQSRGCVCIASCQV